MPQEVLVTGATGSVGPWIVAKLLQRGYFVRAAVRTESKGQHLLATNTAHGDTLQIVVVCDIAKNGAFDEAVKGVDGIIHTASPATLDATEPKDLTDPAVNGAVGVLSSTLNHGASSLTAALSYPNHPVTVAENYGNEDAVRICEEKGRDATPLTKYATSKTLAEKAVWEFYQKVESAFKWHITGLNLPWMVGPVRHEVTTPESLNSLCKYLYYAVFKDDFLGNDPLTSPGRGWVDVRDIAEAHIVSLETSAAGGERILISTDSFMWQDMLEAVDFLSPQPFHTLATGIPGITVRNITISNLSLKYKTRDEMVKRYSGRLYPPWLVALLVSQSECPETK